MLDQTVFAAGVYSTVGGAIVAPNPNPGTNNWTAVRNGVGDVTLTWASGEQIDAAQSVVVCAPRAAVGFSAAPSAQTDTTLQILAANAAGAAAEAIVGFVVRRTGP